MIADDDMSRLSYSLSKYRDSEDYYSWDDLNNYLKSSLSKVNIVITPPKRWFTDFEQNKSSRFNL